MTHYKPIALESSLEFYRTWEDNLLEREAELEYKNDQKLSIAPKSNAYDIPPVNIDELLKG